MFTQYATSNHYSDAQNSHQADSFCSFLHRAKYCNNYAWLLTQSKLATCSEVSRLGRGNTEVKAGLLAPMPTLFFKPLGTCPSLLFFFLVSEDNSKGILQSCSQSWQLRSLRGTIYSYKGHEVQGACQIKHSHDEKPKPRNPLCEGEGTEERSVKA